MNARTFSITILAALLAVLTLASAAGAACSIPITLIIKPSAEELAEIVKCLNKQVEMLEMRLSTERMHANNIESALRLDLDKLTDRLETLERAKGTGR